MSGLCSEVDKEKQRFLDSEREISERANEYKLKSATVEATVARARKECEAATRRRMDLQKQYQLTRQRVALTRAQITKNQATVDDYHRYCEFLQRMTPDGRTPDCLRHPADLVREIDRLESGTLFLLRQCESLGIKVEESIAKVSGRLSRVNADLAEMAGKLAAVPTVADFAETMTAADVKRAEEIDAELARLRAMIARVHECCLGATGKTIPALLMVERIETGLEDLYARFTRVSPAFADAKQKKKDAERLEQHKLDVAERKVAEQKLKIDAAIERAQMPIFRRTGRPLMRRMLPITVAQNDPERSRAERRERERIERLLYGADECG
jgi:chromosome segregation ATPase